MNSITLVTNNPDRLQRAVKNDGSWSLTEIDLTGLEISTIEVDQTMTEHLDRMLFTIQLNLNH